MTSIAGNAVLYECVRTLLAMNVSNAYNLEAANILGKFLQNSDLDIRFVSLALLLHMTSIDERAVLRQKGTILACLREQDPSIRRRALELIIAIVDLYNVEEMVRELLQFMVGIDMGLNDGNNNNNKVEVEGDELSDLISKVVSLVQQFSPSPMWQVDTLLTVLRLSGDRVHDEVLSTLAEVVGQEEDDELACYTVRMKKN